MGCVLEQTNTIIIHEITHLTNDFCRNVISEKSISFMIWKKCIFFTANKQISFICGRWILSLELSSLLVLLIHQYFWNWFFISLFVYFTHTGLQLVFVSILECILHFLHTQIACMHSVYQHLIQNFVQWYRMLRKYTLYCIKDSFKTI